MKISRSKSSRYAKPLREIPALVLRYFKESQDCNGLRSDQIQQKFHLREISTKRVLAQLLDQEVVTLTFASVFHNPHIKALEDLESLDQQYLLAHTSLDAICVYPSSKMLSETIDEQKVVGRPFQRMLRLGAPQFKMLAFDSIVLGRYTADPRYEMLDDGTTMRIRIRPELDEFDAHTPTKDKIHIDYLSRAKTKDGGKVVIGLARYLAKLSPEHQQYWNSYLVHVEFAPDIDFLKRVMGEPTYDRSIYDAFLQEQTEINRICELIARPQLFLQTFESNEKPSGFGLLDWPTSANFESFILTLDKMISDNLNQEFFEGAVEFKHREQRDGLTFETHKGTLRLLGEWLDLQKVDLKIRSDIVGAFKWVRSERQAPAHKMSGDYFNEELWQEQDECISKVYKGARLLRELLSRLPGAESYMPPLWLDNKLKI